MTALQVFAVIKKWVKSYTIPTNAVPLPLPRNQLAADVQNTLQKADQEPINRQAQIDDLNHEIQSTNQSLQATDANLSGLNQNVIAINEDLQKTNLSLWGTDGDNGKIATLETQNNSQQNSLADHKERIENLESDFTDHVENEDIHVTLQDKNKWDTAASGGIAEAPKDGKQYARQDEDWSEIEGGGYEPPVGGIPRTDLSQDVQTSLGKADSALQSETDPIYTEDKPNLALKTEVENLSVEMEMADTALEYRINQNETDINAANDQITSLKQAENTLEGKHNTLDQKVTDNIINEAQFDNTTSTLAIKSSAKTINALFSLASASQNGVMPKEVYALIEEMAKDLASLKGVTFVPKGTLSIDSAAFELLSDTDRTSLVLSELGITEILVNDGIKTSDNITWIFNENSEWVEWGDTVIHIATTLAPGIVLSADDIIENRGKVFVEVDGSQSVIGWDWLVNLVNTKADDLQSVTITSTESTTKFNVEAIAQSIGTWFLQIAQKINGLITLATGKQDKLTSTGTTNLLLAPSVEGGQPGTKAVNTLLAAPAAQTANTQVLLAPATQGNAPTLKALSDILQLSGNQTLTGNKTISTGSYTLNFSGNITVPTQAVP